MGQTEGLCDPFGPKQESADVLLLIVIVII